MVAQLFAVAAAAAARRAGWHGLNTVQAGWHGLKTPGPAWQALCDTAMVAHHPSACPLLPTPACSDDLIEDLRKQAADEADRAAAQLAAMNMQQAQQAPPPPPPIGSAPSFGSGSYPPPATGAPGAPYDASQGASAPVLTHSNSGQYAPPPLPQGGGPPPPPPSYGAPPPPQQPQVGP